MDLEIPQDFTALSPAARAEFRTNAIAAFTAIKGDRSPEQFSDDEVARMTALSTGVKASKDADAAATAAATERTAAIEAAAGIMTATTEAPETPAVEPDAAPVVAPVVETETVPVVDSLLEAATAPAPAPTVVNVDGAQIAAAVVSGLVASGIFAGGNAGVSRVSAGSTAPVVPINRRSGGAKIVAAKDIVKGVGVGQEYDMDQVAQAFAHQANQMPRVNTGLAYEPTRIATFSRGADAFDGFTQGNRDFHDDQAIVEAATNQSRLPNGSLVAAGGWCAPSETLYDLCSNESLDGLVSLPEMQVNRGGIRFTTGPDFSTIYASAGFCQTEAQAIAGVAKPCVEVACPDFEEVRLDACGLCVRAPILTNVGYPELVRRWIDGTFVAHRHKVNARTILAMANALAAAPQVVAGLGSAAADTLNALELAAEGVRYKYRMRFNETLEVILPHWILPVLRADLALRNGRAEDEQVSDEQITAYFTRRNLAVQFVYDWQDLAYPDTDPGAPVVPGCVITYPATVEALIYPAGTFLRGTSDVINLSTIYDTAGLQANMYTAAFFEEGILVAQVCFSGCRLTIPLCVSGKTGAPNIDACPAA